NFRRSSAGNKHSSNHQISFTNGMAHVVGIGSEREQLSIKDVVQLAQPVQIQVYERDPGSHTDGDLGGVGADDPPAYDADICRRHARHSAEQNTASAALFFKISSAHLDGHASGNLGHRRKQGQSSGTVADGFIRDAGDSPLEQFACQFRYRREVKISKQNKPIAEEAILLFNRLLDFNDHGG